MIESITHYDMISIRDILKNSSRMENQHKNKSPFLGLVRIYENDVLNTDQTEDGWLTNMTIATGREFVAQAITKKNSPSSVFGDITNYKVNAFGIGSGGSTIDVNNNITLTGPALCDVGMYAPIYINSLCLPAFNNNRQLVNNIVKFIESSGPGNEPGSIVFETPLSSDFQECSIDYYSVIKNTCIIDGQEPSNLNPGESVKIDEAMLFFTSPTGTNPLPFAHICFAPKFIELETTFRIEWYVIC
jgi:hypothetical protein